jgi:4-alpha-glucanotransferase
VKDDLFKWWIQRLNKLLSMFHFIRIDHFRAFVEHYVIPIDIDTQKPQTSNAHWIDTPYG